MDKTTVFLQDTGTLGAQMLFIIAIAIMGSVLLVIVTTLFPGNIGKPVDLHLLHRWGKPERASLAGSGSFNRDLAPALPDPLGEPPALANCRRLAAPGYRPGLQRSGRRPPTRRVAGHWIL